jgi:hypothetical protein
MAELREVAEELERCGGPSASTSAR